MPDDPGIEAHQTRLAARMAQHDRVAATRFLLRLLAPEQDDEAQGYETLLRRLQQAIPQELERCTVQAVPAGTAPAASASDATTEGVDHGNA